MASKSQRQAQASLARIESRLRLRLSGLNLSAKQQRDQWAQFYRHPDVRRLRTLAGRPDNPTRREETAGRPQRSFVRNTADFALTSALLPVGGPGLIRLLQGPDAETATVAGIEQGAFGIPTRIRAGVNYVGDLLAGRDASYSRSFRDATAQNRERQGRAPGSALAGNIASSVVTGGGAVGLARAGAARLAPYAPRAAAAIEGSTILREGQRARNFLKLVTGGGIGGAAQAAGEGSDISTGAAYGAVGVPALLGTAKALRMASMPFQAFLRTRGAQTILRRWTKATGEEMQAAAERFRQETGTEPTVFEVLPLEDRQNIRDMLGLMPGAARQRAGELVRDRAQNMGDELARTVDDATAGSGFTVGENNQQTRVVARDLARDLARSRGADAPTREELDLARRATRDPTELERLRETESENIMAPFDNQPAFASIDDLVPQSPHADNNGDIVWEESDKEVAAAIQSAAGSLRLTENAITVRNVRQILSRLKDRLGKGTNESDVAQRAINHIEDLMASQNADAAAALARMNEAYAGKSRMLEGAAEGRQTRTRREAGGTDRRSALEVRKTYDTPEGTSGRALGQRAALVENFTDTPGQAGRTAQDVATSPRTQEAIEGNLGADAAGKITRAARAQSESSRRLAALARDQENMNKEAEAGEFIQNLAGLAPQSFLYTKARTASMIVGRFFRGIPEKKAMALVEALFSQDPRRTRAAFDFLNNAGENGQALMNAVRNAVVVGQQANSVAQAMHEPDRVAFGNEPASADEAPAEPDYTQMSDEEVLAAATGNPGDFTGMSDEDLMAYIDSTKDVPYGRAVIEDLFPGVEVTDAERDPNSRLGRANADSYHNLSASAVDVRPIPGMTFEEFVATIEDAGYTIVEAKDEVKHPSRHATGPHWHVVIG